MKLCETCSKHPATLYLTQVDGEEMVTRHICINCAQEMGIPLPIEPIIYDEDDDDDEDFDESPDDISESFFGSAEILEEMAPTCPRCGKKTKDFERDFQAGCAKCYATFDEIIEKRVSAHRGHQFYEGKHYQQGNSRALISELEYLRAELGSAIKQQKFELASVLRDRVRELESKAQR